MSTSGVSTSKYFRLTRLIVIGILILSSLACLSTPEPAPEPGEPVDAEEPAVAEEVSPVDAVEEPASDQPVVEEQPAAEESEADINGFWRTKIIGKQIMVFEFQDGGVTTWHYHYSNGMKKELDGTYSLSGNTLTIDVDKLLTYVIQKDLHLGMVQYNIHIPINAGISIQTSFRGLLILIQICKGDHMRGINHFK